jgi:glucose/arabinose dehydrogenase
VGRHFTRTIKIIKGKLYTSVGSSCDTCRESDEMRATLLVSDTDGKNLRVFARGLRNTVFFVEGPDGKIWGTDMGRDFLGDNLPPDDINIIEDGKDYGWPFCYGEMVRDSHFEAGQDPDYCTNTTPPVFAFPAHVAPLGLTFMEGDLLVALHGSWNSSTPVGYKVVKLDVNARSVSNIQDFITGFIKGNEVLGRPVDLAIDKKGRLFISDDKAGLIYIVTKTE